MSTNFLIIKNLEKSSWFVYGWFGWSKDFWFFKKNVSVQWWLHSLNIRKKWWIWRISGSRFDFSRTLLRRRAERLQHCSVQLVDWFTNPQANQSINRRNWLLTGRFFGRIFVGWGGGQGLEALFLEQIQSDSLMLVLLTFAFCFPFLLYLFTPSKDLGFYFRE